MVVPHPQHRFEISEYLARPLTSRPEVACRAHVGLQEWWRVMSRRGGAVPKTAPVGWVFLDRHRQDGITIRWRRGERHAYVLEGDRLGDHGMNDAVDTIPVSSVGWTDHAEIRALGRRWVQERR